MLSNAFRADIEESGRVGGKGEREKGKLKDNTSLQLALDRISSARPKLRILLIRSGLERTRSMSSPLFSGRFLVNFVHLLKLALLQAQGPWNYSH